jgi:thioredoxin reductase
MESAEDVVVIGGGPAGLAGALWLGRYRLRTLLVDAGDPRNAPTWAIHGYLGIEDPSPAALRAAARTQATRAGARLREGVVAEVEGEKDSFRVHLESGEVILARRVLFATGLRDIIPEIPGLRECYGTSIWHCPDCDGPGTADLRVGVIGWGRQIASFCMEMLTWTERLTLFTHGHEPELPTAARAALERFDIPVVTDAIERIEGDSGKVRALVVAGGERVPLDALFFHIASGPGCAIPARLGCEADEEGILKVDDDFETTVPGVYAAGDITHGSKLAIKAAADGTRAAIGIYRSLLPKERRV